MELFVLAVCACRTKVYKYKDAHLRFEVERCDKVFDVIVILFLNRTPEMETQLVMNGV